MAKSKVGILVTHGIGRTEKDFSKKLRTRLRKRLEQIGVDNSAVAYQEAYWQNVMQGRQELYMELASEAPIDWKRLRWLLLCFLSDASMYQWLPGREPAQKIYDLVHQEVWKAIKRLEGKVEKNAPLIVMAHSLGSHIMSNYIWDRQKYWLPGNDDQGKDELGLSDFQRMKTLASFITFGCNLPLFVLAVDPYRPICVPAPSGMLPDPWGGEGKWLNFYDPDDILGWPLRPLAREKDGKAFMKPEDRARFLSMVDDRPVDVGRWMLQNWNLFSHLGYWDDHDFSEPVADHVKELLDCIP